MTLTLQNERSRSFKMPFGIDVTYVLSILPCFKQSFHSHDNITGHTNFKAVTFDLDLES